MTFGLHTNPKTGNSIVTSATQWHQGQGQYDFLDFSLLVVRGWCSFSHHANIPGGMKENIFIWRAKYSSTFSASFCLQFIAIVVLVGPILLAQSWSVFVPLKIATFIINKVSLNRKGIWILDRCISYIFLCSILTPNLVILKHKYLLSHSFCRSGI